MGRFSYILIFAFGLAACQAPFLVFSGDALQGPMVETDSFAFAAEFKLLTLEVRPEQPYSVILRVVTRDENLYIDAAIRRRWHTYLKQTPNVRIKLGETVYPATVVRVTDPEVTQEFLPGRTIYRVVPRSG